jgi:hypothetical protein
MDDDDKPLIQDQIASILVQCKLLMSRARKGDQSMVLISARTIIEMIGSGEEVFNPHQGRLGAAARF